MSERKRQTSSSQNDEINPKFISGPASRMVAVKPKDLRGTLRRLWTFIIHERKGMLTVFLLSIVSAGAAIVTPLIIGRAIDGINNFQPILLFIFILLAVYISDSLLKVLQGYINAAVSQKIVLSLRVALFKKLQRLPLSFFDTRTHGELMSRLSNDIDNISTTISESLTQLMLLFTTVVGAVVMMTALNIWLTLAALVTVPVIIVFTGYVTKRTRILYRDQQRALGIINGTIEETISGIMVVKAFCMEDKMKADFNKLSDDLCRIGTRALLISGTLMPIMNVINNLGFVSVTVTGAFLAVSGIISTGTITSFLLYSRQFSRPLVEISSIYNTLQTAVAGAERVFEIMDEAEELADKEAAVEMINPRGEIVFKDVSFGYRPDFPVIKDLSFVVKPGSKIAIVGSTGAGKTTIISLLARFYDKTSGQITIDGLPIDAYTRNSLRQSLSVVLQDPVLFNTTVRENIRYGCPEATDEEVRNAAVIANVDELIERFPNGYDTVLADGGTISQGEKQLLSIARAVLSKGPILILDEATSSVDTMTEKKIRKAMQALMENRTSFVIAHRLSTIRDSDRILVIEQGNLVEEGTHDELIKLKGIYYEMYDTQGRG